MPTFRSTRKGKECFFAMSLGLSDNKVDFIGYQSFRAHEYFILRLFVPRLRRFVPTFDQFVPNPLVDLYPTNYDTKCTRSVARLSKNGKRIRQRKSATQKRCNKERETNEKFLKKSLGSQID